MTNESTDGNLQSLVSALYTERPRYGFVPDPITLFDAAKLIAVEGGATHEQLFASLVSAFWRGEFEVDGQSVVFTLQTPRATSTEATPRFPRTDEHGRAVFTDDKGNVEFVDRERVAWTRSEVLRGQNWDDERDYKYLDEENAYADLSSWPLEMWSDMSRRMYWDRLCITIVDLKRWIAGRGLPIPKFLSRSPCSAPYVDDDEAELAALAGKTDEPVKPGDITPHGRPRIPLRVALFLLERQLADNGFSDDKEERINKAQSMLNNALQRGTVRAYGIWAGEGQFADIDQKYWDLGSVNLLNAGPYLHESERYHRITVESADLASLFEQEFPPNAVVSADLQYLRGLRTFSRQHVERWYKEEYIPSKSSAYPPPSRDDDVAAAKQRFPSVPGTFVRLMRRNHAPADWRKGGRRGQK